MLIRNVQLGSQGRACTCLKGLALPKRNFPQYSTHKEFHKKSRIIPKLAMPIITAQKVQSAATQPVKVPRFIDIGVNFTDAIFRGKAKRGVAKHDDDFNDMLSRSRAAGVRNMVITGGSLRESRHALDLAAEHGLFATTGCHPTRSSDFDKYENGGPKGYLAALDRVISEHLSGKGRVVAIGECGLDYDRLNFAPVETQKTHFRSQLSLAKKYHLPLFLHSRAAHRDFVNILREEGFGVEGGKDSGGRGGVVHSFTGTKEEIEELLAMGFHFSINGCGLKTEENLQAAKTIPLDRLLLETDAPWCSMNPSHASNLHLKTLPKGLSEVFFPPSSKTFVPGKMIKGRNEPSAIGGVAWVMAKLKGVELEVLTEAVWRNTLDVFGLDEAELGVVAPSDDNATTAPSGRAPPSMSSNEAFPPLS